MKKEKIIKKEKIFKINKTHSNNLQNQFLSKYKNSNYLQKVYDLKNPLQDTKISKKLREKIIEILFFKINNLKIKKSFPLFFKTIQIMDLYIKSEKKIILKNENLFLIAITSLFISSKYLNINFINFDNFKIAKEKIIKKEFEILLALNFQISFFCYYDHLNFFVYNLFNTDSSKNILLLENILNKFLLLIINDDDFYKYDIFLVIGALMINSIRYFFSKYVFNNKNNEKNNLNYFNQEKKIIKSIFYFFKFKEKKLYSLSKITKKFLKNFRDSFKDLKKINRFVNLKENFFK